MLENVVKMLSKRLNFEMKNLLNQKPSQLPPTNNRLILAHYFSLFALPKKENKNK